MNQLAFINFKKASIRNQLAISIALVHGMMPV